MNPNSLQSVQYLDPKFFACWTRYKTSKLENELIIILPGMTVVAKLLLYLLSLLTDIIIVYTYICYLMPKFDSFWNIWKYKYNYYRWRQVFLSHTDSFRGSSHGIMADVMNWDIVVSEFELQLTITLSFGLIYENSMNPLIPTAVS